MTTACEMSILKTKATNKLYCAIEKCRNMENIFTIQFICAMPYILIYVDVFLPLFLLVSESVGICVCVSIATSIHASSILSQTNLSGCILFFYPHFFLSSSCIFFFRTLLWRRNDYSHARKRVFFLFFLPFCELCRVQRQCNQDGRLRVRL